MFLLIKIVKQKVRSWHHQFSSRFLDTWMTLPFFPARHLLPVRPTVPRQRPVSEKKSLSAGSFLTRKTPFKFL
jgi:hypothetical protein